MSDNTERIVVEVDGTNAESGFGRIKTAASSADAAVNSLGNTTARVQSQINTAATASQRAATGLQQAGQAGQGAAQGINAAGNAAQGATNHFNALQQSLFGVRGKAAFIWDIAADGFRMAMGFADSFIDRASAIQRTFSLLATIPGADADESFEYLTRTANNYGLSLKAIQDDYAKLNLAAAQTKLTSDQVKTVFEQVSMATRTLHMNQQQTQLTFLAVEQMLSKGKVSMEELRKQFAERIPGAMQALSREMGVEMPVLIKLIEKVGASSEKIVPMLGNAVQRLYQGGIMNAAQALDAERNRIETSVTVFFKKVLDAGGTEGMTTLLKTINGLLQTDTIATVFANAMNTITGNITSFLLSLKPDDIERFAKIALDFLGAFATLALAAGKAIIFISQNLPAVGAAIGAFVGATAGAPLGPWGAAIGMIGGGIGGFMGAKSVEGAASISTIGGLTAKVSGVDAEIARLQKRLDGMPTIFGTKIGPVTRTEGDLNKKIAERDALKAQLDPLLAAEAKAKSPFIFNTPNLPDLPNMRTGSAEEQLKQLIKEFGLTGGKNKEAEAAAKIFNRQQKFIEDLEAQVKAIASPESDRFESQETNMRQAGITSGPLFDRGQKALEALQADYNAKKQKKANEELGRMHEQGDSMFRGADADTEKFRERFDIGNLQQLDDNDWAVKARKMANQLDAVLIEQEKKWADQMAKNPLFNFGFDKEKRLAEMREIGDAYIEEFKRIESEKKTAAGGTKAFLKEWNDNVENFGKTSYDFLKGVSDNITDMLTNMVMTGDFSFKKLTQFVLSYIAKMLIVQAITPFINMAAGALSNGLAGLANIGTSMTSQGTFGSFDMPRRAKGGPVWPGQNFLVGEKGPEVVSFDRPGYVHPNESLRGGGSGDQISIQINIDAGGGVTAKGDGGQMANLGRKIGDAVRAIIVDEKRPGGMLA